MQRPEPRDGAESDLKTAGPVDAELGRILIHPSLKMLDKSLREALIIRVQVGAPECEEILVAIKLPDNPFIPCQLGTKLADAAPMDERRPFARYGFEMKIGRRAELQILVSL